MSTPDAAQPPLNSYAAVWGGSLVATFLAAVIYGITVLQTFYYYNHYYRGDRITWRILVATIFVLDSAAIALLMYCMYYYLVSSWGIPEMMALDITEFPVEYILTTLLVFLVQGFYINTIRALRAPIIVTITLEALSITALATGLMLPVLQLQLKFILKIVVDGLNHTAFNIARGTALGCDIGIVIALCWLLGMRRTNIKRADDMISTLMIFAVQRGVLQAVVQAGELMAYAIKPANIYFLPFHFIASRIYCTSVLATLNSREYVARKGMPTYERERGNNRRHTTDIEFNATPPARATDEAEKRPASGVRPVFSSFLEPPFLRTDERSGSAGSGSGSGSRLGGDRSYSHSRYTSPPGIDSSQGHTLSYSHSGGVSTAPGLTVSSGSLGGSEKSTDKSSDKEKSSDPEVEDNDV